MADREPARVIQFEDRSQPSEDVWMPDLHQDQWTAKIHARKHRHSENLDVTSIKLNDFVDRIGRIGFSEIQEVKELSNQEARPVRTWSASICEIGNEELLLKCPLTVTLEDYGEGADIIASWPEVEAWGSGSTDSEAINALKDEIVILFHELSSTDDAELGKLPRRWKRALTSIISDSKMNQK